MTSSTAILAALMLPVVGAILVILFGRHPNRREAVTLITGVSLFAIICTLIDPVQAGIRPSVRMFEFFPGIEFAFKVEPLGLLFALIASGLWVVTSLYAIGYLRGHKEKHQTRFFTCFALAIAGALGVAFSSNLLTLFIFYEMLTLSTYPLVTHAGTPAAVKGGRVYMGILLSTSVGFLLPAVAWTWSLTGTLDFTPGGILHDVAPGILPILLALFVFGTGKAALMPFHRWLPSAMVAPTPVSALLHAVAVVKAGVFTVLKVVVYVFGLETIQETSASDWLLYVAGATILLASFSAMRKDNLKARLAYSTISQLAYIVLGAALANSWGIIGGGMHIAMHAFGKITLFFCAGAIYVATHKTCISQMRGLGKRMPITMGAFGIGALSVIGLPPFGGSWSKWYLALGSAQAGEVALVLVLMLSSVLNVAYLLPIVGRAFFSSPPAEEASLGFKEAPLLCVAPLCLTACGCLVLFFYAGAIGRFLGPIVGVSAIP